MAVERYRYCRRRFLKNVQSVIEKSRSHIFRLCYQSILLTYGAYMVVSVQKFDKRYKISTKAWREDRLLPPIFKF